MIDQVLQIATGHNFVTIKSTMNWLVDDNFMNGLPRPQTNSLAITKNMIINLVQKNKKQK